MKKTIIIISSILVLIIVTILGIVIYSKEVEKTRIREFETAARKYYDMHMSNIKGLDQAEISLKMINYASNNKKEKYEISSLEKCNENSKIILTIVKDKVKDTKISLNCK